MATRSQLTRSSLRRSGGGGGSGSSGITSINGDTTPAQLITSANGTVTVTQPVAGTTDLAITGGSATWPTTAPRIYAVDGALGNDAHKGYADPASNSPTDYATACAAAGAVAKRTLAGLAAIFPRFGAGRTVVILIKAGTYAEDLTVFLNGVTGYSDGSPLVRGTVTNASAGSVAFAGDINDATMAGAVTVTGLNAPGYNPTGTPTTSVIQCLKVGGAAPAFAAEPAVPQGWRIRFDITTTTVALRNACAQVARVTGTDTLHLQLDLPAVPVAGDKFYLEQGGVVVNGLDVSAMPSGDIGIQLVGIRMTTAVLFSQSTITFILCGAHSVLTEYSLFGTSFEYLDQILGAIVTGGGLRVDLSAQVFGSISGLLGLVCVRDLTVSRALLLEYSLGCAVRKLTLSETQLDGDRTILTDPTIGTTGSATGIPRIFGGSGSPLLTSGSMFRVGDLDISGAGANPGWTVEGICTIQITGDVSGATGNTDVGVDLQQAELCRIAIAAGHLPTLTGTAGDLRWSGPAFGTWTQFNFQEQWDTAGNHVIETVTNAEYDHAISPSVTLQVNNSGGVANAYNVVTHNGASLQFKPAVAGDSVSGILDHQTSNGEQALVGAPTGYRVVNFVAAPALGAQAFLSTTPGLATTSPTATFLGIVVGNAFPGNLALVLFSLQQPVVLPTLRSYFEQKWMSLSPSPLSMFDFDDLEIQASAENAADSEWRLCNGTVRTVDHGSSVKCDGTGLLSEVTIAKRGTTPFEDNRTHLWMLGGAGWFVNAIDVLDDWRTIASATKTFGPTKVLYELVGLGVFDDVSTTNFSFKLQSGGVAVNAVSTVAFSPGWHYGYMYFDPVSGKTWGSIDDETPVLISSSPTDQPSGSLTINTGAISGAVTVYPDAYVAGCNRP